MLSSTKVGRVFLNAPSRRRSPSRLALTALLTLACAIATHAFEVRLTEPKGQPIADAIVSLVPVGAPAPLSPPATPVVVTQRGQEFFPYTTPIVVGTEVTFFNDDKVEHHIYSASGAKKFELPRAGGQTKNSVSFEKAGVVAIGCNIHDWMSAYVVVLTTPFFATSTATGAATLPEVPAGRYRLEIWHPRLAKPDVRELTLPASSAAPLGVKLSLSPDRRIRRAPVSAGGGSYK